MPALRTLLPTLLMPALVLSAADRQGATGRIGPVSGSSGGVAFHIALAEVPGLAEKPVYMMKTFLAGSQVTLGFLPSGRIYVLRVEPGDDRWIPVKGFTHVTIHPLASGADGAQAAALLKPPPTVSGPLSPGSRYLVHAKGTLKGVGPLMGREQDLDLWLWATLLSAAPPE